ncbi:MAG: DsbA family protein [Candidatus Limnocylindrales bacterium]
MDRSRLPGYLAAAFAGALLVALAGGGLVGLGLLSAHAGSAPGTRVSASPGASGLPGPSAVAGGSFAPASPGGSPSAADSVAVLPATAPESLGRADAPVVVEVWADFQCPFCALFTHGLEPTVVREFVLPGTARLVFRDFAFLGPESTTAAVAARCAGEQGAFWRFHDLLFASQNGENQGTFSDAFMAQLASYLQLDAARFATCVKDPAIAQAVTQSRTEGERLGIAGTPSLRLVGPRQTILVGNLPTLPTLATDIDRLAHGLPVATPSPVPPASARPSAGASAAPGASGAARSPEPSASR